MDWSKDETDTPAGIDVSVRYVSSMYYVLNALEAGQVSSTPRLCVHVRRTALVLTICERSVYPGRPPPNAVSACLPSSAGILSWVWLLP